MRLNNSEQVKKSKHFCLMPWIHFHVNAKGNVPLCCDYDPKGTYKSSLGNINHHSLNEIWNGEIMNNIRKRLLNDEPLKECESCYKNEKSQVKSLRQHTNDHYIDRFNEFVIFTENDGSNTIAKPIYWDIRFSNICNFKCRMCWHASSSKWFEDAKKLKKQVSDQAIIYGVNDSPKLLDELYPYIDSLEEVYFAGGEPFLMDESYKILEYLISKGNNNIHIRFNTNLSVLKHKKWDVPELLNQFKKVTIDASFDGMEKRGEFIRKGMVWDDCLNNFHRIKDECKHVKLQISCTLNIFNVFHAPDFHYYMVQMGYIKPWQFFLNIQQVPGYQSIVILPADMKKEIANLYENYVKKYNDRRWMQVIDFMYSSERQDLIPQFLTVTYMLDKIREENTFDICPELRRLENYGKADLKIKIKNRFSTKD